MSKTRLYQSVAQKIVDLIDERGLNPGSHLPNERELALQFGVSRSTIREAEIALAAAGRISIRSGYGVMVSGTGAAVSVPQFDELQLLEAMSIVIGETAALVAIAARPEQAAALDELQVAIGTVDSSLLFDVERQFYRTISALSNNPALVNSVEQLLRHHVVLSVQPPPDLHELSRMIELLKDGFRTVVAAIGDNDSARAREAVRAHFGDQIAFRLELLEQRAVAEIIARNRLNRERFQRMRA